MKAFALLASLLVSASAIAIPDDIELHKRQYGSKTAKVLKTLTPEYGTSNTRAVYMWGPFTLPPSGNKHSAPGFSGGIKLDPNSDTPGGAIVPPCKSCTVHKAMANFAYADGKQADVANGVYIHHIIVADFSGKMQVMPPVNGYMCPKGGMISSVPPMTGMGPKKASGTTKIVKRQGMSVFLGGGGSVGSGNPFSARPGTSNVKAGYYIGQGNSMYLTSEIVNYDNKAKEIYLTIEMEWSPGKDPNMLDVGMGAISADSCVDKERGLLHPPKDKAIIYKGEQWTVGSNGYFMNFTPHIHDGGVNVKVFVNGKEMCEAKAIYGNGGGEVSALDGQKWQTISGYTPCDVPFAIKRGDKVQITSEYDLTKHRLRPDNLDSHGEAEGMALANFIFATPFMRNVI